LYDRIDTYEDKFIEAMDDDFNTADAISVIFDLVKDVNTNLNADSPKVLVQKALKKIRDLGKPLTLLQKSTMGKLDDEVQKLIEKRQEARKEKNWALADKVRDELKAKGIELQDTPQGVKWRKI
ncbi:MAG TPA: cysteine--tRNA ligase, partial [Clostridiaceae bacterium]|nr:cysteine--tRNA ligase [Clostridiaceae bacterium]